jgi:flavin reductase (DIM6/NTAB) family NADH-FMN oxidoreductase RutF
VLVPGVSLRTHFTVNPHNPPSPETLEQVFRSFPYALFIIVAGDRTRCSALVATWATQVSFHPPMLAIAIEQQSALRTFVEGSKGFSVNFLPAGEKRSAAPFLKTPVSDGPSIAGLPLAFSADGIPLLPASPASIVCRVAGTHEAGDHVLYTGEVVEAVVRTGGDVLTLKETGWKYFR